MAYDEFDEKNPKFLKPRGPLYNVRFHKFFKQYSLVSKIWKYKLCGLFPVFVCN